MRVLVVDIGGTNVKILATGQKTPRKFPSGRKLTPKKMVAGVKELAADWKYDAVAIGYPGRVRRRPHHGGTAQPRPRMGRVQFRSGVRVPGQDHQRRRDAGARQLQGRPDAVSRPRHRPGLRAGRRWRRHSHGAGTPVHSRTARTRTTSASAPWSDWAGRNGRSMSSSATARLIEALHPDDVVLGGGNAKKLKKLPKGCRPATTPTRSSAASACGRTSSRRPCPPADGPASGVTTPGSAGSIS